MPAKVRHCLAIAGATEHRVPTKSRNFLPLEAVKNPVVDTATAAFYLNRRPQTLRTWAMRDGFGPIRPLRINGRLAWQISEIRTLLGLSANHVDTSNEWEQASGQR